MPRRDEKQAEMSNHGTIWPFQSDSCRACWNKPLTADEGPNAPRAHGIVASLPVHLVEKNGKTTIVCYVAKCTNCGHIQSRGAVNMIFKMPISHPDTHIERWPEILRNDIDPFEFEEAILRARKYPIYLDSRNGLKEPPLPKEWEERLVKFLNGKSDLVKEKSYDWGF